MNILSSLSFRQKQALSVVFSVAVYTWMINWQAAILIVIAISFHEMSHLTAAKYLKLKTNSFLLLPFLGGVAFISERYKSYGQQAFVVLLGPVGGGLLAVLTAVAFHFTGYAFLGAAATWMCFINLFNLAPMSFLDGGQLMDTISYSINRNVGFVLRIISTVVALVVLWFLNPIITVFVLFFGGSSIVLEYKNWKHYRAGELHLCTPEYIRPPLPLTIGQAALTIGGWLLTAAVLLATIVYISKFPMTSMSTIFHK